MRNISTSSKIFAFVSISSGSVWLGSYLARLFLNYQLFEGPGLVLKSYVTPDNIHGILYTLLPSVIVTFFSFILMVLFFILFLISSKLSLKISGWLFIICILLFVTLPFEVYLMLIDYKLILGLISGSFDSQYMLTLIRNRIQNLSSFPIVELFCYLSFYYFIVFQPLTKIDRT